MNAPPGGDERRPLARGGVFVEALTTDPRIVARGTDNPGSPAARRAEATERLHEDLAGARFWGYTADAEKAIRDLDELYVGSAYLRAADRDIRRLRRLLRGATA